MRVVVLGTGALGCVFAAKLAACAEVWMLGTWTEGIEAVRRDGIRVHEIGGGSWVARVQASADPSAVPRADVALLLVKSYQTARAAGWAAQVLGDRGGPGLAVTLQNGLDNGPRLAAAVGNARTALGVAYVGGIQVGPGVVRHTVQLPSYIGRGAAPQSKVDAFGRLLNSAGLETHVTDEIEPLLWSKAIANAAINPLTALWRVANGEPLATPDRCEMLAAIAVEAAAVAGALGVRLPFADPVSHVESICRATAANRSSMLQDVERGRPTEIDSINGVIATEGRRLGVPVPLNEAVWKLVRGCLHAEPRHLEEGGEHHASG